MEDVVYQNARNIWFTMPDGNRVVVYDPTRDRFFGIPTDDFAPLGISIDPDNNIWVTAYESGTIGRFTPTTLSIWNWYETPSPDSGPVGLLTYKVGGVLQVWITESKLGTIGRLQVVNNFHVANREKLGPGGPEAQTWGMIRSSDGHIWVADLGRNLIYELTEPFIHRLYVAIVQKELEPQD
jgi:streptogramin lyase